MRILETALYAENLEETAAFYETVLGLERFAEVEGRHVFFRLDGSVLLLFKPSATAVPPAPDALPVPAHGTAGPGHACFAAPGGDLDRWHQRLIAAGVAVESAFTWPQGGRSVYFRDPAGNSIEFAEPRIWGLS
ncbi:glyoxalase/bleomycin resistance/extradiol dioxygenase family protein [Acuticoccus sediminis]|uniref:Glyoxalase/bleomycin resistance/extradiol dioxygenase family protein n=1 Tax=Acuticoccus sediminis TaxID=2184697 RepID=A0A8B2NL11_9HYPH|nr:VOC family protein [Acuticoccus sediminis]RAH97017.1 glyoxalase/bleomycin resistance/extradiol dioxygenase family protein [Acuticoccus sediminis]